MYTTQLRVTGYLGNKLGSNGGEGISSKLDRGVRDKSPQWHSRIETFLSEFLSHSFSLSPSFSFCLCLFVSPSLFLPPSLYLFSFFPCLSSSLSVCQSLFPLSLSPRCLTLFPSLSLSVSLSLSLSLSLFVCLCLSSSLSVSLSPYVCVSLSLSLSVCLSFPPMSVSLLPCLSLSVARPEYDTNDVTNIIFIDNKTNYKRKP